MNPYLRIARIDHWFKNIFMIPGVVLGAMLADTLPNDLFWRLLLGVFSVCLIASANYTINEWLDRSFDRFHPIKKARAAVQEKMNPTLVYLQWAVLAAAGLGLSLAIGTEFLVMNVILLIMGVLYNVPPIRTKDLKYLDVLSESINNPLRFLLGWYIIAPAAIPPSSVLISYWMGGAFLMGVKRYAEYRHIANPELAGQYRRSFRYYTEESLLLSSLLYAFISAVLLGVFLVRYKVEFLLSIPLFSILFVWYLHISMQANSASQAPEKLYRDKGFMAFIVLLSVVTMGLFFVEIPWLAWVLNPNHS